MPGLFCAPGGKSGEWGRYGLGEVVGVGMWRGDVMGDGRRRGIRGELKRAIESIVAPSGWR